MVNIIDIKKWLKSFLTPVILSMFCFLIGLVLLLIYIILTINNYNALLLDIVRDLAITILIVGIGTFLFEFFIKVELLNEIREDFKMDMNVKKLIKKVYKNRDEEYQNDVKRTILFTDIGEIKVAGIALIDFFNLHDLSTKGFNLNEDCIKNHDIKTILYHKFNKNDQVKIKVLFSNIFNKDTIGYRYICEEEIAQINEKDKRDNINTKLNESLSRSVTVGEVKQNIKHILRHYKHKIHNDSMSIRLYDPQSLGFLLICNETMFIEPYTLAGPGGNNIILQIEKDTPIFEYYNKHFDTLWDISSINEVKTEQDLTTINNFYKKP